VPEQKPSDSRQIALADPAATEALGRRIAAVLRSGDVVCLSGDLGAGKTTLARGVIAAWTGAIEEAPSPTYTLVQTYAGAGGELWHVDLYRLTRPEDAWELGLEEAFGDAVCLIEWPERLAGRLPRDRLEVTLIALGAGRVATLVGRGAWSERIGTI
jgi:tRNA threonylcarbamoyl adenosine modification protein YjeE